MLMLLMLLLLLLLLTLQFLLHHRNCVSHRCIVRNLQLGLPLLKRQQRHLACFLMLLLRSVQISLCLRFYSRNPLLPKLLLLQGCCGSLVQSSPQLSTHVLALLQLQQHAALLLVSFSPQCRVSIAQARDVVCGA